MPTPREAKVQAAARVASPHEAIRERCRALGLPVWRCSADGRVIESPRHKGAVGTWLRSGPVSGTVCAAAASLGPAREIGGPLEPSPGLRVIVIPELSRRRVVGRTAVLVMGGEALDSRLMTAACTAAGIPEDEARRELGAHVRGGAEEAARVRATIEWMFTDLERTAESDESISGFASQLTDSFETIDFLYSIGRAMDDLTTPDRFVRHCCERLRETLNFGWIAARFNDDRHVPKALAGRAFLTGRPPLDAEGMARATGEVLSEFQETHGFIILDASSGLCSLEESQALAQAVGCDGRVIGAVLGGDKKGATPGFTSFETQLFEAVAGSMSAFLENASLYADQRALFLGTLQALTASIDAKDRYTCGHSERVALVASQLATIIGFDRARAERVRIAGLVHDVGKIGVPESVLCKPGRLTNDEFALIRLHPEIGHRILKDIPLLEDVLPAVLHHHERWDGRGYPAGLKGEDIPLIARLIGLADTFDAMSSTRSYRDAMPRERVLAEIAKCAGTQFDPTLAAAFTRVDLAAYDAMTARHAAEHAAQMPLSKAA